ncbi:MAG: lamin tail domain-containing protein, partial [Dolichospermum sp.]
LVNSGLWNLLVTYNGRYYLKYQTTLTWSQAKVLCEQNGGYMYCVNSQLENDNVSIPIANSQAFGNFLLGLYQDTNDVNFSEPTGGWKWLDGSPLTYTNWGQNEPNNNGGGENYNVMDWNNNGAVWNDITDVVNGTVIMEYPGITTYIWSTGETTQTINPSPNQTTQYWVDVTTNGVTCRKFITINVNTNIAPSINVLTQSSCTTPSGSVQITSPISGGITPQNIFISEVTDANSGALSYIELFNKTGNSIDLSNYKIKVYNNGGTTPSCVSLLSGLIANNSTYVIKLSADANQNGIVPNFTLASCGAINTDDNIRLTTANDVEIDIWGRTDGIDFTPNNQPGYTYRRNSNAILPSTTWSPVDWDAIDPEDYTNIG